jgi:diguanylate cyclase (GGDEF)-like protein/PAS domain S-box-containing protein
MNDGSLGACAELPQSALASAVLENLRRAVVVTDDVDRVVLWNVAAQRLTGYSDADALGRRLDALMWAEAPYASADLPSTTSRVSDWIVCTRDGDELPLRALVETATLPDGRVGRIIEVVDTSMSTALSRTDQARFEQASVPQALIDLEARFRSVNPAWCRLFGYSEEELVDQDIMTVVHAAAVQSAEAALAALRRGDMDSASYEILGRHADGASISLLLDATVLRDVDGSPSGVAAFARDVTEVKEARRRLAAQENLYRALNRRSSDAAVVTDGDLTVTYMSPSLTEVFGHQQADVLSVSGWDFVHPDDVGRLQPLIDAVLAEPEGTQRFTVRIRDAAGQWRWVEETISNCLKDPDIGGLVINLRDITAQVEDRRAMRESEARYRAIVETAQEGILVINGAGSAVFANSMMAQMLGMSVEELLDNDVGHLLGLVHATDVSPAAEEGQARTMERVYAHPDGSARILLLSLSALRTDEEESVGMLVMASDVTAARHAESELRHRALHDPLTDLPNRYLLADRLEMAAARQQRSDGPGTAVLFLDLDRFKVVNDSHGHEVGDTVLREVARRLDGAVRSADTVARLGGDEFAVVCEESDRRAAQVVAARIHHALAEPIEAGAHRFDISASIGVAVSPPLDSTELLRRADVAMYQAKQAGGAATVVFAE